MLPISDLVRWVAELKSDDQTTAVVPNRANIPLATPRSALEQEMLEQISEMISSNKFDDEVIDEIKNLLSEDGNGTVGNLVDVRA